MGILVVGCKKRTQEISKKVEIGVHISFTIFVLYSDMRKRFFSPGSRHIGEGDIVVADAAKARQDLCKGGNNQVLPVPDHSIQCQMKSEYFYTDATERYL